MPAESKDAFGEESKAEDKLSVRFGEPRDAAPLSVEDLVYDDTDDDDDDDAATDEEQKDEARRAAAASALTRSLAHAPRTFPLFARAQPAFYARRPSLRRRTTVCAERVHVEEGWEPRLFAKSDSEKAFLLGALQRCVWLSLTARSIGADTEESPLSCVFVSHLHPHDLDTLAMAMQARRFEPGDVIIRQGDDGDLFYIVETGRCAISIAGVGRVMEVPSAAGRAFFGELALLYDAPRAATVAAERATKCWALDRTTFRHVIVGAGRDRGRRHLALLRTVPILGALSDAERAMLAGALRPARFAEGEVIFEQGAAGERFYIVEDGAVACTKLINGVITPVHEPLRRGDYFGELALLRGERRAATCTAIAPTTCCTIDCETFKRRGCLSLSRLTWTSRAPLLIYIRLPDAVAAHRILGPLEALLQQNSEMYEKYSDDAGAKK